MEHFVRANLLKHSDRGLNNNHKAKLCFLLFYPLWWESGFTFKEIGALLWTKWALYPKKRLQIDGFRFRAYVAPHSFECDSCPKRNLLVHCWRGEGGDPLFPSAYSNAWRLLTWPLQETSCHCTDITCRSFSAGLASNVQRKLGLHFVQEKVIRVCPHLPLRNILASPQYRLAVAFCLPVRFSTSLVRVSVRQSACLYHVHTHYPTSAWLAGYLNWFLNRLVFVSSLSPSWRNI